MERKTYAAEVKVADRENLIVEHFISTETKDRVGDIVRANGMRIKGKPVVLLQHGHGEMGSEPVAKPLSVKKGEYKGLKGIIAKTQFFPDDMGRRLFDKTVGGYMPNWSIGFMTLRDEPIRESGQETMGRDIKEWELLEYSLVGVPANPDAQTFKDGEGEGKAPEEDFFAVKFLDESRKNEKEELLDGDGKIVVDAKAVEIEVDEEEKILNGDPAAAPPEGVIEEDRFKEIEDSIDYLASKVEPMSEAVESMKAMLEKINAIVARLDPPAPAAEPAPAASATPEKDAAGDNPPEPSKTVIPRLVIVREQPPAAGDGMEVDRQREVVREAVKTALEEVVATEINRLKGKVP